MENMIKTVYEGDWVKGGIGKSYDGQSVLLIACQPGTFESDEGNLEWDTVVALYSKDAREPNRFTFEPMVGGISVFSMEAKETDEQPRDKDR